MDYNRFINWFIHPALNDDLERYVRAYQLIIFSLFSMIFFLVNAIKWYRLGCIQLMWSMISVGIIAAVMLFVFRWTGKIAIPGYCMMGSLNFHFVYLVYLTGGFDSTAINWLIVVPLLSSMYFSNRFAALWTSFLLVTLLFFLYYKLTGYPLPSLELSPEGVVNTQIANYFGPLLAVFIASWFFNNGMRKAFEAQKKSIEIQEQAVDRLEAVFDNISEMGKAISEASTILDSTAEELSDKSRVMNSLSMNASEESKKTQINIKNMADSANRVSQSVTLVASSSNELSTNLKEIGSATSNVSDNLNTVSVNAESMSKSINIIATAIEQMYASLNEVSKHSSRGASVTSDAAEKAIMASNTINILGTVAEEIGGVLEIIKGIASQTHILALNATIEAVGAGESGRGFRVVANEVKDLARQTTSATDEIRKKILGMQTNTKAAVKAIEAIVLVITEINDIMGNIAVAVDQQTRTTNEIAKSISGTVSSAELVSQNVREAADNALMTSDNTRQAVQFGIKVSENLDELAGAAEDIAEDATKASEQTIIVTTSIVGLSESANITSMSAARIKYQAENLTHLAAQLRQLVK